MYTNEWTFTEDIAGVVYCLGKQVSENTHEAVAVYEYTPDGSGSKRSLVDDRTYNRIMYHGFPEELDRLQRLRPEIRNSLLGNLSLQDNALYINTLIGRSGNEIHQSIDYWLSQTEPAAQPFREALERTCIVAEKIGITLTTTRLYGGISFGLVGKPDKVVDDVDLLLSTSSEDLNAAAQELRTPYTWNEIDPNGILSKRRALLKAKRWSTSQIRLFEPSFLTIDLKAQRDDTTASLWEDLPAEAHFQPFSGELKVVDDVETYCISPAVRCEDKQGNIHSLLFRGYPYVGCAVKDDIVEVRGKIEHDSGTILVTQASDDILIPDFSNVPIL